MKQSSFPETTENYMLYLEQEKYHKLIVLKNKKTKQFNRKGETYDSNSNSNGYNS